MYLEWIVESDTPEGTYDVQVALWEESDRDNLSTRLDDEWDNGAFEVEEEKAEIDGQVNWISPRTGTYTHGDSVETTANVENTGSSSHTYFLGYSVHGPDGEIYDNDDGTGRPVSLSEGESRTVDLEWKAESDAPDGEYDVQVALWEESDRDNLSTRLDDVREYDAFDVVEAEEEIDGHIHWISPDSGEYTPGSTVETIANVGNTGNASHTYFLGYSVHGPDGEIHDNDETTGKTISLQPGESTEVTLEWTVESEVTTGHYDTQVALWEENDRDGLRTRLDEQWEYEALRIENDAPEIEAEIIDIETPDGTYSDGDPVVTTATILNTGTEAHTFFAGYTLHDSDGNAYDNDGETGQPVTVHAGEELALELEWLVEDDGRDGEYDVQVTLWEESDRDDLSTRIDDEWSEHAFQVSSGESVRYTVDVEDARGSPLDDAAVTLRPVDGGDEIKRTSADGVTTFSDIPSGDYELTVRSPEVNQTKEVGVYVDETHSRHRVVFDPARPVVGAVIDSEGAALFDTIDVQFGGVDEVATTNAMGLFKTSSRIPLGVHNVEIDAEASGTSVAFDFQPGQLPVFDPIPSLTIDRDDYPLSLLDANSFTSLYMQYVRSTKEYDSQLLAAAHGCIKGLLTGFSDFVDGVTSLKDVIVSLATIDLRVVFDGFLSLFSDLLGNLQAAAGYLVAALKGIPDKYWETVDGLVEKQDDDNPHRRPDDTYMPFAVMWYLGYSAGGLIIGGAFARLGSIGRSILQRADRFEEAVEAGARTLRRADEPDGVSPGLVGTFQDTTPDFGRSVDDLPLRGSYLDVQIVSNTITEAAKKGARAHDVAETSIQPLLTEFVFSAYYRNHWQRGKHSPTDPAADKRENGKIVHDMKGNVNEELVAASLLKGSGTNRLKINRNDLSLEDLQADYVWNEFQPAQLGKGESALIQNYKPDRDIADGFELDFVRVTRPDTTDGEPALPVVTHVLEPTSDNRKSANPSRGTGSERLKKASHINEKVPQLIEQGYEFLPGTNLPLYPSLAKRETT
ncbi:hypothetical protein EA473_04475 [Natrarchaeobius chitinivorans]|uniref:Fervidolysin/DR-A0283-like Ig-like domain-containing protein n=1 Tax=Natrarchaeobius chitinivorans TaxID=1679083 RepID=A0A3N6PFM0_NATCH|nr:hypothetical protein EA473_04475 [Natrarchaeobius chitinivorans]